MSKTEMTAEEIQEVVAERAKEAHENKSSLIAIKGNTREERRKHFFELVRLARATAIANGKL